MKAVFRSGKTKYSGLRNARTPIMDPPLGWPWAFAAPPPTHFKMKAKATHYFNIPRLQQKSCATLVGHLNNAFYISRKKKPTRCCILEGTIGNN